MEKPTFESAYALHRAGNLAEAKTIYLALIDAEPKNVDVLHMLAIIAAEEGELSAAENYLEQALSEKPNDSTLSLHLANILKAQKNYAKAITILEKVIVTHPDFAAAENNLATICFVKGNYSEAIAHYQKAIDKQPNYSDAYYNLGLALIKDKRFQEAKQVFESLLLLTPNHPGAQFQLARMLMQESKYQEAIKFFLQILQEHPHHFETLVNLGTSYLRIQQLKEAEIYYLRALEIAADVQVLFNLGVIAMQRANINQAIYYYTETVKLNANHFDAHNNLGIAYLAMNDSQNALKHFREASRIEPHNEAIKHTVRILSGDKTIVQSPPDYIRALFDSYADHYEAHLSNLLHYEVPTHLFAMIKAQLKSGIVKNMLDLGCGTGLCGELFTPYVKHLIGVDLSPQMLSIANEKNFYDELIEQDVTTFLQDRQETFDLIVAGDVLVYFGDLDAVFSAVYKRLNPNGLFLFNAEINLADPFCLTASGRFAHQQQYLDELAGKYHFKILSYEQHAMRTQNKKVVEGHFYLLEKV